MASVNIAPVRIIQAKPLYRTIRDVSWRDPLLLVLFALFALSYTWFAGGFGHYRHFDQGRYDQLAQAFLAGQTNLLIQPAPELIALADPYDPVANGPYRQHDMSLYQGKFFMYFGPTAALWLYVPWRWLTGTAASDRLGVILFSCGALFFGFQVLRMMLARMVPATSARLFYCFSFVLGFSSVLLFLLRRPSFYEVAISSGQCFLMAGFVCLLVLTAEERGGQYLIALAAGTCFGFAIGGRASLLFLCAPVLLLFFFPKQASLTERRTRFSLAVLALTTAGIGLLVYNYVRFDSPFEFGTQYQLTAANQRVSGMFRADRVLPGLYYTAFAPLATLRGFPYIGVDRELPWFDLPENFNLEAIAGMVWVLPFVLGLLAVGPVLRGLPENRRQEMRAWLAIGLTASLATLLTSALVAATMRYAADWAGVLSILCFVVWAAIRQYVNQPVATFLTRSAIVLLGIWTVWVNGAIALVGY